MQLDTLDDKIELNPSDSSNTPDAAASADSSAQVADATSSESQGADASLDTLSIVRDVVGQKDQVDGQASPAEGQDDGSTTDAEATKKDADDENYSDVPFHKHPRFQHLLREKKTYEVDAKRYQNVQGFLDNNGLNAEEAADGLTIMAMMKTDPAAAWERLKPTVQKLLIAAGEVLPDDLADQVQRGAMPREAAIEVSRARAQVQSVKTSQSFAEQQATRRAQEAQAESLVGTATSWESDRRAKDPNFEAKFPALMRELKVIQYDEGKPKNVEGVKDQLNRAYKAVVPPAPPAPAVTVRPKASVRPPMSGQVNGNPQPKPETTLDIIRANRVGR